MPTITLYSKPNCPLCDQARHHLQQVLAEPGQAAWALDEVNILEDPDLYRGHRYRIPVIAVAGGAVLVAPLSLNAAIIRRALALQADPALAATVQVTLAEAAAERARMEQEETDLGVAAAPPVAAPPATPIAPPAWQPETGLPAAYRGVPPPAPVRALNALGSGLTRHWLTVLTTLLGVWVTLPWLAPVFAKLGWWGAADAIYTTYIFFCHHLPERAGNLFGYQVAWCYRNSAIYTSMFVTAVLFLSFGRHGTGPRALRQGITWKVLLLCLLPGLIDGLTHMAGLRVDNAWFDLLTGGRFGDFSVGDSAGTLNWWLRVTTGALAGTAAVLFAFPWMHRTLAEEQAYWGPTPLYPAPPAAPSPGTSRSLLKIVVGRNLPHA
jgi:uncharacterized membrane protein